jgi:hypothetical protein
MTKERGAQFAAAFDIDMSESANSIRWDRAHPDAKINAIGADNNGRLPVIDGAVYPEDVADDTEWFISILFQ